VINLKEASIIEAQMLWPEAEVHLREAVSEREEDPESFLRHLKARVFAGLHTLWILEDEGESVAYAVTVLYSPDGITNIAQIYMAQGRDLDLFLSQMDQFIAWTLRHEAHYIEVIGRKGWEKVLKPYGFTHNYTSLLRRINEELH